MRYVIGRLVSARPIHRITPAYTARSFQTTSILRQEQYSEAAAHRNFWKSHGRAMLKAFTLAFFSYQVFYWAWITLETEQMRDEKDYQIKSLEGEVRLLDESRKSHRPAEQAQDVVGGGNSRILEESKKP